MEDYDPAVVDIFAERCAACGEIALRRTALGETPAVEVRWRAVKGATCDHMVLESISVTSGTVRIASGGYPGS